MPPDAPADAPADAPLVVAHRGSSLAAPEHTLAAYRQAVVDGADSVELDLRLTADGTLVCIHDAALDRVAGTSHVVEETRWSNIAGLDVGSWFNATWPQRADGAYVGARIPTLANALEALPAAVGLHLELKDPQLHDGRMEERLVRELAQFGAGARVLLVESFDVRCLERIKQLDAALPTGLIWTQANERLVRADLPGAVDASAPNVFTLFLHLEHVLHARARGMPLHVWTVNDEEEVHALLDLQVAAIVTDDPRMVRAVLERGDGESGPPTGSGAE